MSMSTFKKLDFSGQKIAPAFPAYIPSLVKSARSRNEVKTAPGWATRRASEASIRHAENRSLHEVNEALSTTQTQQSRKKTFFGGAHEFLRY